MHCATVAKLKRAAYKKAVYWGKPVPGFGDPNADFWIVGLAPGAHGANRTGRVFTGDKSGEWLYAALFKHGWSSHPISRDFKDPLQLKGAYISCVVRCAPPQNKPKPEELNHCFHFLQEEWHLLKSPALILCLGKIAFEQIKKLLGSQYQMQNEIRGWKFFHGGSYKLKHSRVLVSYHPSQQNTQTGKLTLKMWNEIFLTATKLLKDHSFSENKSVSARRTNGLD